MSSSPSLSASAQRDSLPLGGLLALASAGDRAQQLTRVLRNALQATLPQSTRRVEFRAWRSGATVHLAITDNGPGMTAEVYRQVSSAFFSAPSQGVGLGRVTGVQSDGVPARLTGRRQCHGGAPSAGTNEGDVHGPAEPRVLLTA